MSSVQLLIYFIAAGGWGTVCASTPGPLWFRLIAAFLGGTVVYHLIV